MQDLEDSAKSILSLGTVIIKHFIRILIIHCMTKCTKQISVCNCDIVLSMIYAGIPIKSEILEKECKAKSTIN